MSKLTSTIIIDDIEKKLGIKKLQFIDHEWKDYIVASFCIKKDCFVITIPKHMIEKEYFINTKGVCESIEKIYNETGLSKLETKGRSIKKEYCSVLFFNFLKNALLKKTK